MKAIVHDSYGSPDVLQLTEVEQPTVADDNVLVRVRASSVNAFDWRIMRGQPWLVRAQSGLRKPARRVAGADVAGVVEAVGKGITDLRPGDEVFGSRGGAYAEFVAGKAFVPKPVNLTFEQAAAVPGAGCTALQAVRDHARIEPGQRVLVNGAGGGVGTFLVQIAKAYGAHVTAVTSTQHLEVVGSIGADRVIDYRHEDFTRGRERYDTVLDVGGTPSLGACRRALTPEGTLVLVGAGKGRLGPLSRPLAAIVRTRVLRQRIVVFIATVTRDDLRALKDLIEAGKVVPVIDRTYPLAQAAEAVRYMERGHARGKVVITV
jgi:NADPH:quinone reductase-like Zn-dependent oxidoreductase